MAGGNDFFNLLVWPAVQELLQPLQALLREGFSAGFVLDGFEERSFPPENTGGSHPLSWNGRFSEIPPVVIGRMRLKAGL